ncbi:hypothetical protein V6N12_061066 [Hibiscus sabdariffa]|uniref:RNase H type-1 domain-containing protein n=1 Tax=Hibiscus sabdariffa TaxID=183260 RepID=A0ABR2DVY6_9ROSI
MLTNNIHKVEYTLAILISFHNLVVVEKSERSCLHLELAWAQGFGLLMLQTGCAKVAKVLNSLSVDSNPLPRVRSIARLWQRGWVTDIVWVPRVNNWPTNMLARSTEPQALDMVLLHSPPQSLLPVLHEPHMHRKGSQEQKREYSHYQEKEGVGLACEGGGSGGGEEKW